MRVTLHSWEDGQQVEQELHGVDRWQVHAAEKVVVTIDDIFITLTQQPKALTQTIGVGACLWDSALVLSAYLASLPRHRFLGARCVELGAGVGLVGILLAKRGAQVHLTDKHALLSLLEQNVKANQLSNDCREQGYSAAVTELQWGSALAAQTIAALAAIPLDLVVASDCCYVDQGGVTPSTQEFLAACAALCAAKTTCLVAFERRSSDIANMFLVEAAKLFSQVKTVKHSAVPFAYQVDHVQLFEMHL